MTITRTAAIKHLSRKDMRRLKGMEVTLKQKAQMSFESGVLVARWNVDGMPVEMMFEGRGVM